MSTIRIDNGLKHCNREMQKYLLEQGIKVENTAPYTPEQNGAAERDNRTAVECARTILLASELPFCL